MVTTKLAPKLIDKLHDASLGYAAWKVNNEPDNKPWLIEEEDGEKKKKKKKKKSEKSETEEDGE